MNDNEIFHLNAIFKDIVGKQLLDALQYFKDAGWGDPLPNCFWDYLEGHALMSHNVKDQVYFAPYVWHNMIVIIACRNSNGILWEVIGMCCLHGDRVTSFTSGKSNSKELIDG